MKKFLISSIFIAIFGVYAVYSRSATASTDAAVGTVTTAPATSQSSNSTATSDTGSPAAAGGSPPGKAVRAQSGTASKAQTGKYKDSTYTGSVADAYYGNMQVQVTISGGKITDVAFLQYPNDRSTSRTINAQAMPMLRAEAIQAQSANVSGVSGASASSGAFKQTLASALAQA